MITGGCVNGYNRMIAKVWHGIHKEVYEHCADKNYYGVGIPFFKRYQRMRDSR